MKAVIQRLTAKITDYAKRHMSVGLISTGVVLFFCAAFVFQGFLQNEYLQYLLTETRRTEQAVLSASVANVNSMIQDAIVSCADVVTDADLYESVENIIENRDTYQNASYLYTRLNTIAHYNNIAAVAVVTEDGLLRECGRYWNYGGFRDLWRDENLDIASELYEKVMDRAERNTVISYEVSTEPLLHEDFPDLIFFHLAYPLLGNKVDKTESCAVMIFTISLDSIIKSSALTNAVQGEYITEYLTDGKGTVLYHNDSSVLGENEEELDSADIEQLEAPLNYLGWDVHINIDTREMKDRVQLMFSRGMGVYLLILLICIVIWQLLLWRILRPVGVIGKFMEKIRKGNLSEKIRIEGSHELWQLAEQYNHTVEALEEQREETKREYEEKAMMLKMRNAAEKEALEAQINAHFLCNTIGAINYSAMENGDTEVSVLLKNLSGILYYAFSKETKMVTLGDEIGWVKQYLYLQKFRLMDVFDYEIHFPEEYSEWPCCKLFLQPFVENSILHGFEGWEKGGRILITGEERKGRLMIKISDNGCGMTGEKAGEIRKVLGGQESLVCSRSGIGIANVAARLRMYYGPEMEIHLDTALGDGTCFTFWLPIPADMLGEDEMPEEGE